MKRSLRDCPAALLGFPLALAGDPAGFPLRFSGSFGLVRAGRCGCGNLDGISLGDDFGSFDSGDASSISRYFLVVLARRLRLSFFASVPFFIDYTFYGRGGFFLFFLLSFSLSLSSFFFYPLLFLLFPLPCYGEKCQKRETRFASILQYSSGLMWPRLRLLRFFRLADWMMPSGRFFDLFWIFFSSFSFFLGDSFCWQVERGRGGGLFQRPGSRLL